MKKDDQQFDLMALARRAEDTRAWLKENGRECFAEQKHIRGLNQEKIYWHYGYLAALTDVLRQLTPEITDRASSDKSQSPDSGSVGICN
jgi:hypothetical protein